MYVNLFRARERSRASLLGRYEVFSLNRLGSHCSIYWEIIISDSFLFSESQLPSCSEFEFAICLPANQRMAEVSGR